jgi:hypothetical protein
LVSDTLKITESSEISNSSNLCIFQSSQIRSTSIPVNSVNVLNSSN